MKRIIHTSRFHNVGQGQFYSSSLYLPVYNQEFNYVIDCGSEQKTMLNKEIIGYSNSFNLSINSLDLLIVSHLHYDHVSGIHNLLSGLKKKSITVKKIILPYFDGPTRIFLFLKWKSFFGTKIGKWYFDFISDPLNYLVNNFGNIIEEINIIMPTGNKISNPKPDKKSSKDDLQFSRLTGVELQEPNDLKKPKPGYKTKISYLKSYSASFYGVIEFDFWFRHVSGSDLRTFQTQARKEIDRAGSLEKIFLSFQNKKNLKNNNLVAAYEVLSKASSNMENINDTSLCVSITPIGPVTENKSIILPDYLKYSKSPYLPWYWLPPFRSDLIATKAILLSDEYEVRNLVDMSPFVYNNALNLGFGYLFTGDIMLRKNRSYQEFANHYIEKKEKIKILCIPHHGAWSSWNPRIIDEFGYPFSIVSAGSNYKHGHPHYTVSNYLDKKVPWVCVNENNPFNFSIELIFP